MKAPKTDRQQFVAALASALQSEAIENASLRKQEREIVHSSGAGTNFKTDVPHYTQPKKKSDKPVTADFNHHSEMTEWGCYRTLPRRYD